VGTAPSTSQQVKKRSQSAGIELRLKPFPFLPQQRTVMLLHSLHLQPLSLLEGI